MDTEARETLDRQSPTLAPKKPPRKPRPSEIAAKQAKLDKAAAKKAGKKATKPRALKRKPAKTKKVRKHTGKRGVGRTARLDLRVTPTERKVIEAFAKRKGLTKTEAVMAVIAKMK